MGSNEEHRMLAGSHERPHSPECRCGAAWDCAADRCVAASLGDGGASVSLESTLEHGDHSDGSIALAREMRDRGVPSMKLANTVHVATSASSLEGDGLAKLRAWAESAADEGSEGDWTYVPWDDLNGSPGLRSMLDRLAASPGEAEARTCITMMPGVRSGWPCVNGSRLDTKTLAELAERYGVADTARDYEIPEEAVQLAVDYESGRFPIGSAGPIAASGEAGLNDRPERNAKDANEPALVSGVVRDDGPVKKHGGISPSGGRPVPTRPPQRPGDSARSARPREGERAAGLIADMRRWSEKLRSDPRNREPLAVADEIERTIAHATEACSRCQMLEPDAQGCPACNFTGRVLSKTHATLELAPSEEDR